MREREGREREREGERGGREMSQKTMTNND